MALVKVTASSPALDTVRVCAGGRLALLQVHAYVIRLVASASTALPVLVTAKVLVTDAAAR